MLHYFCYENIFHSNAFLFSSPMVSLSLESEEARVSEGLRLRETLTTGTRNQWRTNVINISKYNSTDSVVLIIRNHVLASACNLYTTSSRVRDRELRRNLRVGRKKNIINNGQLKISDKYLWISIRWYDKIMIK